MTKYYCSNCSVIYVVHAATPAGLRNCPECLSDLRDVPINFKPKKQGGNLLKFTEEERKQIYDNWKKNIEKIPTQDALRRRAEREKQKISRSITD